MEALAGVMAIESSAAGPMVSVWVEPATPPAAVAVMTTVPWATPVANPALVPLALMVASELLALQVTEFVRFWVLVSEKVPVAVNCCVAPAGQLVSEVGVTAMDCRVGAVMFTVTLPVTVPSVAVTVALPVPPGASAAVTNP
jgi:hypothetical protein